MVALGTGAALTEAATMLPYLAASGIISGMPIGWPVRLLVLTAYCAVMVMPAVVRIMMAALLGDRVWPRLERIVPRLEREAKITLLWASFLVGIHVAANAWVAVSNPH